MTCETPQTGIPRPDSSFITEEIARNVELTAFGPMTISSVACGRKVTNNDLLKAVKERTNDSADLERAQKLLEATGLAERRASWDITPTHEQIVERSAQIGAKLVRAVMDEQGWDSFDYLLDTSASLPVQMGVLVLERANLDPRLIQSKPYRVACAGAIAAFVDTLADPKMEGKRVIVCALEPLSRHVSLEQCIPNDPALSLPAIFGDDYAAIAFNTADYQAFSPRTHVVYDGAPIRFYVDYTLLPTDESSIPPHYSFGERGREISSISAAGFFLDVQKPENGMTSEMDGRKTYKFFVPESIKVIKDVVENAQSQGIKVRQAIMHQPSKKVNDGFQKHSRDIDSLKDLKIPDFLLGEIRRSNSSSATALVIWQYMAGHGMIKPTEPFLVCAPGIGSAISAAVIVPKTA